MGKKRDRYVDDECSSESESDDDFDDTPVGPCAVPKRMDDEVLRARFECLAVAPRNWPRIVRLARARGKANLASRLGAYMDFAEMQCLATDRSDNAPRIGWSTLLFLMAGAHPGSNSAGAPRVFSPPPYKSMQIAPLVDRRENVKRARRLASRGYIIEEKN